MRELVVRGSPRRLDAVLRPFVRGLQLVCAAVATLVLALLEAWWWLPVPLALSFVAYEAFFWLRGDRPVRVSFGPSGIVVDDRAAGRREAFPLDAVRACTLLHRAAPDDASAVEVAVVLSGEAGPLLALSLRAPRASFVAAPEDVDAEAMDALLGGLAGLVRSLAPPERAVRQIVRDARPVGWLRDALPEAVRARTQLRPWRGREPELDDFGLLVGEPTATLLLDGARATLRDPSGEVREAPLRVLAIGRAHRPVTLLTRQDGLPARVAHDLPLLVLDLEGIGRVAIPAPAADPGLPEAALDARALHLHGAEGAALIAHLLRHDLLPAGLGANDPFAAPGLPARRT